MENAFIWLGSQHYPGDSISVSHFLVTEPCKAVAPRQSPSSVDMSRTPGYFALLCCLPFLPDPLPQIGLGLSCLRAKSGMLIIPILTSTKLVSARELQKQLLIQPVDNILSQRDVMASTGTK